MPRRVVFEGRELPASYANFYIANGAVLVPVFNDPNDRIALNTLAEVFPTREIVPIYSRRFDLGIWRAALHDATTTGGQYLVPSTQHHSAGNLVLALYWVHHLHSYP